MDEQDLKEGAPCPQCVTGKLRLRQTKRGDFWGCSNYPQCAFWQPVGVHQQVVIIRETDTLCPQCGGMLTVKRGRYGLFIGCTNYPNCNYVCSNAEQESIACPVCSSGKMMPRVAKSGQIFYSCNNYPECRFLIPGKPVVQSCPRCRFPLMFEKKNNRGLVLLCGNSLCPTRKKHRRKAPGARCLSAAEQGFLSRLAELE